MIILAHNKKVILTVTFTSPAIEPQAWEPKNDKSYISFTEDLDHYRERGIVAKWMCHLVEMDAKEYQGIKLKKI